MFVGVFFNWVQRGSSRRRPAERREATGRGLQRSAGRAAADRRESDARAAAAVEKRERERLHLDGPLRGEVMVFQPMTILDISQTGAQIQTAFALQFGSEHDFLLSLGQRAVIVKGRVAYCHISELTDSTASYRSGVAFVETSPTAASAISDFVSAIQYSRS